MITSIFSFALYVFKRLLPCLGSENLGLCEKGEKGENAGYQQCFVTHVLHPMINLTFGLTLNFFSTKLDWYKTFLSGM